MHKCKTILQSKEIYMQFSFNCCLGTVNDCKEYRYQFHKVLKRNRVLAVVEVYSESGKVQ